MVKHSFAETILAAEHHRAAAVMARDVDALASCLHDDLVYVHATGVRHDKAVFLHYVATGPEFLSVVWQCGDVTEFGETALLHGQLHLQLCRAGEPEVISAVSWASAVWLRHGAGPWRLRQFQSTRVAA